MVNVIICGRNDHSRYIAEEYYKNGVLKRYYTFYYPKDNIFYKILKKVDNSIDRNKRVEIEDKFIKNYPAHFLFQKIFRSLFFWSKNKENICNYITDVLYDAYIYITLEKADVYHLWSQYSYLTIRKIRRKYPDAKILLDVYAAHPDYVQKIYEKNINIKNNNLSNKAMIKRINSEINLADLIIVPTEYTGRSILDVISISPSKIKIIPYGVDEKNFKKIDIKKKESKIIKFLFVGRVSMTKGINYLVEAFEKLNEIYGDNIELNIVGNIEEDCRVFCENIKNNNVNVLGKIPHNKLNRIYNENDIFVFPSLSEGSGMVISEAMSCGIPIITTRNATWVAKNNYSAKIINENSSEDILRAMIELIENNEVRENISENALRECKIYTWDKYYKTIEENFR